VKSKLIAGGIPEAFSKDLEALKSLSKANMTEFLKAVAEHHKPDEPLLSEVLLPVARRVGVTVDNFLGALRAGMCMLQEEGRPAGSTRDEVLADLVELGRLQTTEVPDIAEKLQLVKELAGTLLPVVESASLLSSTFPKLEHVHSRCCLVASLEPEFNRFTDKPDSYQPTLQRTVAAVVLQLDIDRFGETDRISFGLSESELEAFINQLRLAQKQLRVVLEHRTASQSPSG